MTITLSREELEAFQARLSEWYYAGMVYALENARTSLMDPLGQRDVMAAMDRFATKSPCPSWRSLL